MTEIITIHHENPQPRLLKRVVDVLRSGGVIVYPTDSAYALGCQIGDKDAADKIRRLRQLDKQHNFTLVCRDLSQLAVYALVDNAVFRLLKANTPGPYTFILMATKEVPRRLQHPKRKTIGVRVPDCRVVQALLEELGEPMMSVSLILPDVEGVLTDVHAIDTKLHGQVDLLLDAGVCGLEPTTVISLVGGTTEIVRQGQGSLAPFIS